MSKQTSLIGKMLGIVSAALLTVSASGVTIYDNSANDLLTRLNPGNREVGDEITFAGTARYLTQFDFEYYGTNTGPGGQFLFSGLVQARVKFYLNDGALFNGYATPGTVLFDSGWYGGFGPTPRNTFVFSSLLGDFPGTGLFIPANSITWSVQFQGMGATDQVGVDIYSPPVVGSSFNSYWENNAGSWSLVTNNIPMNFAARFQASETPVPEPTTVALMAIGGLGLLVARRVRKA